MPDKDRDFSIYRRRSIMRRMFQGEGKNSGTEGVGQKFGSYINIKRSSQKIARSSPNQNVPYNVKVRPISPRPLQTLHY